MTVPATFNEKLLLGNGLLITPLSDSNNPEKMQRSLRDIVHQIDNERDLQTYIKGHSSRIPSRSGDIEYKQHPVSIICPSIEVQLVANENRL